MFVIAFLPWRLAPGILTPLSRYGRPAKESHFAKNAQPAYVIEMTFLSGRSSSLRFGIKNAFLSLELNSTAIGTFKR
jgi:hypothetical protein